MSETATAINAVEIDISNDEHLIRSARETADFVNIPPSEFEKLQKRLPLKLGTTSPFNKAGFGVRKEMGQNIGEIGFKHESDITSQREFAVEERTEETTHYLHTAANTHLTEGFSELRELNIKDETAVALAVEHSLAEAERARHIAIQDLDKYAKRLDLVNTHSPETPEEIIAAVKIKTGEVDRGNAVTRRSMLSAGQSLRIIESLDKMPIPGDIKLPRLSYQKALFVEAVKELIDISENEEELMKEGVVSSALDKKQSAEARIQGLLAMQIEELLKYPESLPLVYRAFKEAGVSVDSVEFRSTRIEGKLASLTDAEAKNAALSFLNETSTAEEILNLSMLVPGLWSQNMNIISEMNPRDQAKNEETLEEMRRGLSKSISELNVSEMAQNPREVLSKLMLSIQRIASTQATVESNLIFLMDDFPVEEKSRANLLANSDFVNEYLKATLAALKSGEFTPANAKLNPDAFSRSALSAEQVAAETLGVSIDQPESVAFFQDLADSADYVRKIGSTPDQLELYSNWQLDTQLIKDGIDLSRTLSPAELQIEVSKAKSQSLNHIRLKQEMSRHKHLMHILVEPIAKVVVAQRLGRSRREIEFPSNMMGGYSALLRSGQFTSWVDKLWTFVDKAHSDKQEGGRMMLEFFSCNTVAEQQAVVSRRLSR